MNRAVRVFQKQSQGGRAIRWSWSGAKTTEFERTAVPHLDAMYGVALRLTHNRTEAEDVVQEAYLRAFRHFDRFDPATNCRAWLFTILRNVFLNRLRRAGRELPNDTVEDMAGAASAGLPDPRSMESPEDRFFRTVLHGDVDRALKALPLPFREAVILADLEGLTYREVADVVGCPIGTVMSRLARGRRLLRTALNDFAREHGYVKETDAE